MKEERFLFLGKFPQCREIRLEGGGVLKLRRRAQQPEGKMESNLYRSLVPLPAFPSLRHLSIISVRDWMLKLSLHK